MRYVVALLVPLLAVLAGCSDEDSEEATSAPSSPPARSSRTAEPTQASAPTQPQTIIILGGETGHEDAPPGVYVVDSGGANAFKSNEAPIRSRAAARASSHFCSPTLYEIACAGQPR